jgi:hypothetical protein
MVGGMSGVKLLKSAKSFSRHRLFWLDAPPTQLRRIATCGDAVY